MAHWNLFADEVWQERHLIREAGLARLRDLPTPDSYKAQALRELAHRLTLEEVLQEVRQQLAAAIDRFEAAECYLDIHHIGERGDAATRGRGDVRSLRGPPPPPPRPRVGLCPRVSPFAPVALPSSPSCYADASQLCPGPPGSA